MSKQDAINSAAQALAAVQADTTTLVTDLTAFSAAVAAGQTVDPTAVAALVTSAQGVQAALDSATSQVAALAS